MTTSASSSFGAFVAQVRDAQLGMTQGMVERLSGPSVSTQTAVEAGRTIPQPGTVDKYVAAFTRYAHDSLSALPSVVDRKALYDIEGKFRAGVAAYDRIMMGGADEPADGEIAVTGARTQFSIGLRLPVAGQESPDSEPVAAHRIALARDYGSRIPTEFTALARDALNAARIQFVTNSSLATPGREHCAFGSAAPTTMRPLAVDPIIGLNSLSAARNIVEELAQDTSYVKRGVDQAAPVVLLALAHLHRTTGRSPLAMLYRAGADADARKEISAAVSHLLQNTPYEGAAITSTADAIGELTVLCRPFQDAALSALTTSTVNGQLELRLRQDAITTIEELTSKPRVVTHRTGTLNAATVLADAVVQGGATAALAPTASCVQTPTPAHVHGTTLWLEPLPGMRYQFLAHNDDRRWFPITIFRGQR